MSAGAPTPPEVRLILAHVADAVVATSRSFSSYLESEVGSRAVCSEILQEAFGRGLQSTAALDAHESAIDWFYRQLRNAVIEQPRNVGLSEPKFSAFRAQVERELEPRLALRAAIVRYVGELSEILGPEHAGALRSVELGGTSIDAFADATGISAGLAGVRLSDARAALRRCVASSAGICSVHGCWNCTCGLNLIGHGRSR